MVIQKFHSTGSKTHPEKESKKEKKEEKEMTKQKKSKKKGMTLHSKRPDPYSLKDWRPTDFTPPKTPKTRKKFKPPKFKPPEFKAVPSTELIPKKRRRTTLRKNPSATDVMRDMRTSKHFKGSNTKKRRKKK